ncbi:MAG: hypothetical protein JL50_04080 [Peptococcaceae bacterium BICA1-7]|nr:MAG: hypothetical protein JL50_04080 [Peptococcaceae bacterium BICA1-7]HBV97558.1 hypothetical protein [Desulfotomaculum sp.]
MKKIFALLLAVVMVTTVLISGCSTQKAYAGVIGPDQARVAKFWIGKPFYEVDGKRYEMDVAPYVKNDRTMMPARFLAYSLGIPEELVQWDEGTQSVLVERGPFQPTKIRGGEYIPPEKRNDGIQMWVGKKDFDVNGYWYGKFDVPPEVIPPGRTMIPYRAVAQALGALVFWDDATQCVTVETWRDVPQPGAFNVKKVTVYKNQNTADVVEKDGSSRQVKTSVPVMITDPRDGGFTLDAIEWFKLWGVPEENILYDPERGGLAIRAKNSRFTGSADDLAAKVAVGYLYFYKGEKEAWDNFFLKVQVNNGANYNFIAENGRFYGGSSVQSSVAKLIGKPGKGSGTPDLSKVWLEILD